MKRIIGNADGSETVIDDRTLDDAQAEAIARIKGEAGARITARYPDHAQRNALARGIKLTRMLHLRAWSPSEAAEAGALETMWAEIDAIRTASNAAEAAVMAATTREEADAVAVAWP
jgi:hypothetical protein